MYSNETKKKKSIPILVSDGAYGKMMMLATDTAMIKFMAGVSDDIPWRNSPPQFHPKVSKKQARRERARETRQNIELRNRLLRHGVFRYATVKESENFDSERTHGDL